MHKRLFTFFLVFLAILILAGCHGKSSKPVLEVLPNDDNNTISITANKAGISGVGGSGIVIAEGQQLVIDSALSKGSIQLKFYLDEEPAGADASLEEILDVTVKSAGTTVHPLQAGEYTLFVNVLEKSTGNITLSAK